MIDTSTFRASPRHFDCMTSLLTGHDGFEFILVKYIGFSCIFCLTSSARLLKILFQNWLLQASQGRMIIQEGREIGNHSHKTRSWSFHYEVIMSLARVEVTLGPFSESLMSLLNTERFWVNLSLFLVSKFLSMPSMRFLNQLAMLPCLSEGWAWMIWFRSCSKYSSFSSISPRRGLEQDEWPLVMLIIHKGLTSTWTTDCDNPQTWWCSRLWTTFVAKSPVLAWWPGPGSRFRERLGLVVLFLDNEMMRNVSFSIFLKPLTFDSHLFEKISNDVIQSGTTAGANHCIWK